MLKELRVEFHRSCPLRDHDLHSMLGCWTQPNARMLGPALDASHFASFPRLDFGDARPRPTPGDSDADTNLIGGERRERHRALAKIVVRHRCESNPIAP